MHSSHLWAIKRKKRRIPRAWFYCVSFHFIVGEEKEQNITSHQRGKTTMEFSWYLFSWNFTSTWIFYEDLLLYFLTCSGIVFVVHCWRVISLKWILQFLFLSKYVRMSKGLPWVSLQVPSIPTRRLWSFFRKSPGDYWIQLDFYSSRIATTYKCSSDNIQHLRNIKIRP